MRDDVIESPLDIGEMPCVIDAVVKPFIDEVIDVMPLIDDVIDDVMGAIGGIGREEGGEGGIGIVGGAGGISSEGGEGGMASDGAPSGLRCDSVRSLLSSFISAANTCSSCEIIRSNEICKRQKNRQIFRNCMNLLRTPNTCKCFSKQLTLINN